MDLDLGLAELSTLVAAAQSQVDAEVDDDWQAIRAALREATQPEPFTRRSSRLTMHMRRAKELKQLKRAPQGREAHAEAHRPSQHKGHQVFRPHLFEEYVFSFCRTCIWTYFHFNYL